jgi:hypothetical protein
MRKFSLQFAAIIAGLALISSSCKDDCPEPEDDDTTTVLSGTIIDSDTTWSNDAIYTMTEKVWVTNGATLTIEPGTIIKANSTTDAKDAVALIVTPGSKIDAEGTSSSPIIFTSSEDDITYSNGSSLTSATVGKWGGIVLIGKATCDHENEPATSVIEGVEVSETRAAYGSSFNDNDDSGVLKYVSIRHGGASVSSSSELNGLSLYGVGSKTTLDYIEVYANDDDGIEFFGGTVNLTHALVVHCSDDSFDWDQGFSGTGQYWCSIHNAGAGDKGFECDGGEGDLSTNSVPTIGNFTAIGEGTETAVHLKKSTGGQFYNGIIFNFDNGIYIDGIVDTDVNIDGVIVSGASSTAVYDDNGDLTSASYVTSVDASTLSSLSWSGGTADVIPDAADAATTVTNPVVLDDVSYRGAFDPTSATTWAAGWTRASELGIID